MEPSSATNGFFQASPSIPPQVEDDGALQRIISLHFPSPVPQTIQEDLYRFSKLVQSRPILNHVADAERNPPSIRPLTTFGVENKQDSLVTSEGWRALQDVSVREGTVALAYQSFDVPGRNGVTYNNRVYQFMKTYLWTPSAAMITCPGAMTDGAASLLGRHLRDEHGEIFAEARRRLVSRDPSYAWTSGQWMTERKGGSDVRGTETVARKLTDGEKAETDGVDAIGFPLGPWRIDGFKWFSSATDANMTIMLARTGNSDTVSAFYAPLRRKVKNGDEGETELNGIRIQRLKNKLGTKPVPTAELELKGVRGYLIGKEGQGVKEISTLLNITRMSNAIGSIGYWGRSLAICRAYAKVRVTSGKLLKDTPAYVRGLAKDHVKYAANMHLTFFMTALLGISEGQNSDSTPASKAQIIPKDSKQSVYLLRTLTPMVKARTALRAIKGVRSCMENLGGVGYLENEDPILNIARIFRDTCVLSIWEGTTDVMADDLMRVIKGRQGADCLEALEQWVSNALNTAKINALGAEAQAVQQVWQGWFEDAKTKDREQLKWQGKRCLKSLEYIVCSCLLLLDVTRDQNEISREITRRWVFGDAASQESWKSQADWDRKIVFGDSDVKSARL